MHFVKGLSALYPYLNELSLAVSMRNLQIQAAIGCLLLMLSYSIVIAQESPTNTTGFTISGTVKDANSREPLPYCNAYLSRSLKGTYTNDDGSFTIDNVSPGTYQLVVSFVGYKTYTQTVKIIDQDVQNLNIRLVGNVETLETLEVVGERDKEWERMMKKFESSLFGKISFSNQCEIINPWVVSFEGDKNKFSATAQQPIEIKNNALGFQMKMNLNSFYQESSIFQYDGYFQFELLDPKNEKERANWEANQNIAYEGSITHFLKSILDDTWQSEGFILQRIDNAKAQNFMGVKSNWIGKDNLSDFMEVKPQGNFYSVAIRKPFLISYQNEYFEGNPQTSSIVNNRTKTAIFDSNGVLTDPSSLIISGYLVQEGISTLLPTDYKRDAKLFDQKSNQSLAEYDKVFSNYYESNPLGIFVRTDKESYFNGETIWMRTYLVNTISNLPKYEQCIINTQLIDSDGRVLSQQKLKSLNGGANSSLIIPDSLQGGEYLLRATLETKGQEDEVVFERPILIEDFDETVENQTSSIEPTIAFFPESGQMVDGITSRVAFKSNQRNASGIVYTEKGKEITSFRATHNGMGFFELKPKANESYYVKLSNIETRFELPSITSEGLVLRADQEQDRLMLQLEASGNLPSTSITLLIHSYGQLVHIERFNLEKSRDLIVPISSLREGINHITLFDNQKRPIVERLFYKPVTTNSSIRLALNDSIFDKRKKVELNISSLIETADTIYTDVSVSVLDISQANQSVDIHTYFHFLDNTNIEYPAENGDFFKESIVTHPDLYMMVYGWKRFQWDKFLSDTFSSSETVSSLKIEGEVKRKNGKPLSQTSLLLINMDNGAMSTTITDSLGQFQFKNLDITDTTNLVLKVEPNQKLVTQAIVSLDTATSTNIISWKNGFSQPVWSSLTSEEAEEIDQDGIKTLAYERKLVSELENYILLNEVVVTTEREEKPDPRKETLGKGDHTINTKDLPMESAQNLFDIVDARVPGLRVVTTGMNSNLKYIIIRKSVGFTDIASQAATILIDNIPIESSDAGMINPQDIESVEIFTSGRAAAFGARGANGVVAFYTKKGNNSKDDFYNDPLINKFVYKNAYYTPTEFFSPNYDVLSMSDKYIDSRATVYWNPNITITNYEAQNISFFTTDREAELLIDIQGVSQTGELIHEMKIISVSD